jgi:putative spermidine/putrescine transport system permease protein
MAEQVLAADGTPLKASLNRALRRQKMRALLLILPLLGFILATFILPIGQMLFRSVENSIVSDTIPRTVAMLDDWDASEEEAPDETLFHALFYDLFVASEAKLHTRLGSRLNYETSGISSLFRKTGRGLDDIADHYKDAFEDQNDVWEDGAFWFSMMNAADGAPAASAVLGQQQELLARLTSSDVDEDIGFMPNSAIATALPLTTQVYTEWALYVANFDDDTVAEEEPWESVYAALYSDLIAPGAAERIEGYSGTGADALTAALALVPSIPEQSYRAAFADIDEDWLSPDVWQTIQAYAPSFTSGYFLNAIDLQKTSDGVEWQPENEQIYLTLFFRTMVMSMTITISCILLGYPVAWMLANLPPRKANLLMILVLLPFWTSLLVRTSAWKVLLQNQGVINDLLVWVGFVADDNRLALINNATGTVIAMTHILLPFMILPLYSVMQTIPITYLRAAKSLGATNWTAFWRVYFPQSIPGIGAGSILVFILSIGYYITPEIVGGTKGVFISNRIAYHISSSLNWGLAAALGAILLAIVLALYWAYDRIVGIDNVKLGG